MNIIGLSFGYHDSAACLVRDGEVLFAVQEERLSRVKNDPRFPELAIKEVLKFNGDAKVDAVVFYEKSYLKFDRILKDFIDSWPFSYGQFRKALPLWLGNKLKLKQQIRSHIKNCPEIYFSKHHESHAASAYFTSGFTESAILTLDGVGEWDCGGIHHGKGSEIKTLQSRIYPDSLGLFYSAMTDFLGFEVNEGEYKVMGLAPYGVPQYSEVLKKHLVEIFDDGQVTLSREMIAYPASERLFQISKLEALLGFKRRASSEPLLQNHFDLAASIQVVLEEAVLKSARHALKITGSKNLCFAGGVALNCVANGKVLSELKAEGLLENLHFLSACGDAGGSIGAALFHYHHNLGKAPRSHAQILPYWGPAYSAAEISHSLEMSGLKFHHEPNRKILRTRAVQDLLQGQIIGWFNGRMEFGPRALGNRSILGDPRDKNNWSRINQMVKFREDFRPLAPAVLESVAAEYFDLKEASPLMLLVAQTKVDFLPATTHVDKSSRVQTVQANSDSELYDVIKEFGDSTGVFALINTSMNTSGMPIVCAPKDAIRCFIESDLHALFIGDYYVYREENPWVKK